jgi:hypothetical protein
MNKPKYFKFYHGPSLANVYGKLNDNEEIEWTDGDVIPLAKSSMDLIDVITEGEYISGINKSAQTQ